VSEGNVTTQTDASGAAAPPGPLIEVAAGPHLANATQTTRRMMLDVLVALTPATIAGVVFFRLHAVQQIATCALACMAFEAILAAIRRRSFPLGDLSALVTGVILGLSLPGTAPWYVGVIGSAAAIGLGKWVFGGLGQNIFNPAMVGRAFVMIAFSGAVGAAGYVLTGSGAPDAMTQATPLTVAKAAAAKYLPAGISFWPALVGNENGSLGETSALACLVGGLYLCLRRTASWEIPLAMLAAVAGFGGLASWADITNLTVLDQLLGGAAMFGAFFIATDPVTSPVAPKGKFVFGATIGLLVVVIRVFSGYPEGVMFAVLLANALSPLINRWTIPVPLGGPTARKQR
jgi:electron transport complex protein RnfD